MRLRNFLLLLLLPVLLLAVLAGGGAVWLAGSEDGLRVAGRLLAAASAGRLAVADARGRLLGPLSIGELRWRSGGLTVAARGVEIDWRPAALARRRIEIGALGVAALSVETPAAEAVSPGAPPEDLTAPLAFSVDRLSIGSLVWNGRPALADLSARISSDGQRHGVENLTLDANGINVTGELSLAGRAPFALTARGEARGKIAGRPAAFAFEAAGPLARVEISARATAGIDARASAALTPFAAFPFGAARVDLHDADPSDWLPGAPGAKLDAAAVLRLDADGPAGDLRIVNRAPGALDAGRLPFSAAVGRLRPAGAAFALEALALELPGGGALAGGGRWADGELALDLHARRIDAARIFSGAFPTALDGPLAVSFADGRIGAKLAWRGGGFGVAAQIERAGERLAVKALELDSGEARLTATGEVETGGGAFAFKGRLHRFDPSRFARRAPEASLTADIEARGRFGERPVVEGRFVLDDSRIAGQPLAGRGRASLIWPRVHDVDLALSAGPNRLTVAGAFGQPGDALSARVDAPRLKFLGVDGALRGRLDLAGSIERPALAFDLASPRLAAPGVGVFSGLALRGRIDGEADAADAPFEAELTAARFRRAGGSEAAREVKARAFGRRRAHRIEAEGEITAGDAWRRLRLEAEGGWRDGGRWLGRALELRLTGGDGQPVLALRRPAEIEIGPDGWSAGDLALFGRAPEWTADARAEASAGRLRAQAMAAGPRFGRLEARIDAAAPEPWKIDIDAPWRGSLELADADLGWLGGILGEGWQTQGKLTGALEVSGTPARPATRGRLDGAGLALRLPDQGLNLTVGELAAEFDGRLLRVKRLVFSSPLARPPRALRQALDESASRFAAPGGIEISGELRLNDAASAEDAFLDVQLERVGAWQRPDQWVAVSGRGRLAWRAGRLAVSGDLGVDAGYWQLAPAGMPRLSDDVHVIREKADAPPGARPNLELDLNADLGRYFVFDGAGLRTRLSGALRLKSSGRDLPRASGSIRLRDGRFDAYGQALEIERGALTFQGLLNDPALDVRAVRKGLAVEAGVQVGGTARRPVVHLVSDPDLPDADKLSWLLLGHGPESMGAGDAALLVSAAGELLGHGSGVTRRLKETLGIDEIGIRQGDIGGNAARAPTSRIAGRSYEADATDRQILSIGKRLSANALLAYEQSLTTAESVVKLTVELTRRIAIVGRAGSDNALDVFYTLTFGQPPGRAGRGNERKAN